MSGGGVAPSSMSLAAHRAMLSASSIPKWWTGGRGGTRTTPPAANGKHLGWGRGVGCCVGGGGSRTMGGGTSAGGRPEGVGESIIPFGQRKVCLGKHGVQMWGTGSCGHTGCWGGGGEGHRKEGG